MCPPLRNILIIKGGEKFVTIVTNLTSNYMRVFS